MGNELFRQVADLTGLPSDTIQKELTKIANQKGLNISELTLDELRDAMASYLRDVIVQAKEHFDLGILDLDGDESETVAP